MVIYSSEQYLALSECLNDLKIHFNNTVLTPLRETLGLIPMPALIIEKVLEKTVSDISKFSYPNQLLDQPFLPDENTPLLKRAVMFKLRELSETIESQSILTHDGSTKNEIGLILTFYHSCPVNLNLKLCKSLIFINL